MVAVDEINSNSRVISDRISQEQEMDAMKEIRTEDAVGHVLCHDITQIIKDEKRVFSLKKVTSFAKKIFRHFFPSEKTSLCLGKTRGYSSRK